MYRIHVKNEVATTLPFTKIYVDDEKVGKTSVVKDNSFDSDKYEKKIYLKGIFFKTNSVSSPSKDSVYNLTWKQNYLFTGVFVFLLITIVLWAVGDNAYSMGIRIVVMFTLAPVINFVWNDLLILGRKIEIKEIGE